MTAINLHRCDDACEPACNHSDQERDTVKNRHHSGPVIDTHCHVFVPEIEQLVADCPERKAELDQMARVTGKESMRHNAKKMIPKAFSRLIDPQIRLNDMDELGIDIQLIIPSPSQYYYWADETLAAQLVEKQNQLVAELCNNYERFLGLGSVAPQHPELAAQQLKQAIASGLKGVQIGTSINGQNLSDPALAPFWEEAEKSAAVIFIHPFGTDLSRRMDQHYMSNLVGQPLETTIALSDLILSGFFDNYPSVKIMAAHAGGALPFCIGRLDHGHKVRPEVASTKKSPSEYLQHIWFDSVIFSPQLLRSLLDIVGADRVVLGTDYPFDMGHFDIHAHLDKVPGLTEQERQQLLTNNAATLLDITLNQTEVTELKGTQADEC